MAELVATGIGIADVLRMATLGGAQAIRMDAELGTIAAGRSADLVLLDANPLENIANTRRISAVMIQGRWLTGLRYDLSSMLEARLRRPVDLVVLNHAPVDLIHRVLRDGVVIIERDRSARIRFEVKARNEFFDHAPLRARYRSEAWACRVTDLGIKKGPRRSQ